MSRFKIMKYVGNGGNTNTMVANSKSEYVAIKDTQFNIWAFLFGILYMIYRGLYMYALGIFVVVLVLSAMIRDPNAVTLLSFAISIGLAVAMTTMETYWYEQQGYKHVATLEAQDYASALVMYQNSNETINQTINEAATKPNTQEPNKTNV